MTNSEVIEKIRKFYKDRKPLAQHWTHVEWCEYKALIALFDEKDQWEEELGKELHHKAMEGIAIKPVLTYPPGVRFPTNDFLIGSEFH